MHLTSSWHYWKKNNWKWLMQIRFHQLWMSRATFSPDCFPTRFCPSSVLYCISSPVWLLMAPNALPFRLHAPSNSDNIPSVVYAHTDLAKQWHGMNFTSRIKESVKLSFAWNCHSSRLCAVGKFVHGGGANSEWIWIYYLHERQRGRESERIKEIEREIDR